MDCPGVRGPAIWSRATGVGSDQQSHPDGRALLGRARCQTQHQTARGCPSNRGVGSDRSGLCWADGEPSREAAVTMILSRTCRPQAAEGQRRNSQSPSDEGMRENDQPLNWREIPAEPDSVSTAKRLRGPRLTS